MGIAKVVECLSSKLQGLCSILSTNEKQTNKQNKPSHSLAISYVDLFFAKV
jgi:hypothetical protein